MTRAVNSGGFWGRGSADVANTARLRPGWLRAGGVVAGVRVDRAADLARVGCAPVVRVTNRVAGQCLIVSDCT